MNSASQFVFSPKLIFVIAAGLIVLSMIMGRKQGESHRSHVGWWIGLGVLLVLVSSFLGYSRLSFSPTVEERRSQRSPFQQAMDQMKEQIQAGMETARDSLKEGLEEVNRNVDDAKDSLNSVVRDSKSTSKVKKTMTTSSGSASSTIAMPATTVQWTEEVKDRERSQQEQLVEEKLRQKAAFSVNRWVNERMPLKTYAMQVITSQWLKDNGAFPDPPTFIPAEVPRANTNQKDTLYGGTLTVVLHPNMQQTLMELGYHELEQQLQSDKFEVQGVMFIILMSITGFVALLGLVKYATTRRAIAA